MKKLTIFFLTIICLCLSINLNNDFSFNDIFMQFNIQSYTKTKIDNSSISIGKLFITQSQTKLQNLEGESFCCDASNFELIIDKLDAIIIKKEIVNDMVVIYGFSSKIKKCVFIQNKKINLQFAFRNEYLVVGWPLILGSF